MKISNKLFFCLILGIVLILGGCGQAVEVGERVSQEQESAEAGKVDTSDWQTYKNEEYGFEFKYQPYWEKSATDIGVNDENSYYLIDYLSFNNPEKSFKNALPLLKIVLINQQKDDRVGVNYGILSDENNIGSHRIMIYEKNDYSGFTRASVIELENNIVLQIAVSHMERPEDAKNIMDEIISTLNFLNI